jgi:Fructose-bisphosphate aldolase class-I
MTDIAMTDIARAAAAMVSQGKGILAADESPATMNARLVTAGVPPGQEQRRADRGPGQLPARSRDELRPRVGGYAGGPGPACPGLCGGPARPGPIGITAVTAVPRPDLEVT